MTEHTQMPLVGPPIRRGWREIVRFQPLTTSTHVALVITRRGRLASVLPANSPRTLSDYLSWPYDFREVDTRERLLAIDQRLDSCDAGYQFGVALRLAYQVAWPERVALDREDVLVELEHAIVQRMRPSGRAFGVEQAKVFEEHLADVLLHSEMLVDRVRALGIALRRVDVIVTLDEDARAYAEELRLSMRERPLHFQVTVESLEPERGFDVHVGGVYRLTERRVKNEPTEATEAAIQLAIARTLRGVGLSFAPSDYPAAAKAMVETLRRDPILQSELSVAQVQLLQPTVQIQPDRSMIQVSRPATPALPDARPEMTSRRDKPALLRASPPPALPAPEEATAPWAELSAASGRALPAALHDPQAGAEETSPWAELLVDAAAPAPEDRQNQQDTGGSPHEGEAQPARLSAQLDDDPPAEDPFAGAEQLLEPIEAAPPEQDHAAPELEIGVDDWEPGAQVVATELAQDSVPQELLDRLVGLLQSHGPAWFKMWVLELKETPERLPEILAEVTADPVLLQQADDQRCQSALLLTLAADPPPAPPPIPPVAATPATDADPPADGDDLPDWLRLRAKWNGNGGGA